MSDQDPHQEPENSTVDNWMGQEVDKDADLAERLVEESGGDMQEAERKFEQQSEGAQPDPGEVPRANGEGYA
jgi:hypothetical protein